MMSQEERLKRFFSLLEQSLREELKASPFPGTRIINNYQQSGDYNITVEFIISGSMPIFIVCDTGFPSTNPPKAFCIGKYISDVIDFKTDEILYQQFYQWKNNSKLVELVTALNNYFEQLPPVKSQALNDMNKSLRLVKELIQRKLQNINYLSFEQKLHPDLRAKLSNQSDSKKIILESQDVADIKERIRDLVDKALKINEEMNKRIEMITRSQEENKQRINEFQTLQKTNKDLTSQLTPVNNSQNSNNVKGMIRNQVEENKKQANQVINKIRQNQMTSIYDLEQLLLFNTKKAYYNTLLLKLE